MMKKVLTAVSLVALAFSAAAQTDGAASKSPEYKFTTVLELPVTSVKNQSRSGTCWCFSALSFLESEVIRINNIKDPSAYPDFSEMFIISKSYKDRADKYIRTDGNINFAAGSEFEDVLHVIGDYGLVPQSAMPGLQKLPQHTEVDAVLKSYVDAIANVRVRPISNNWLNAFESIEESYFGVCPESFSVDGKDYTPASYRDAMKINPKDYVTITSFTHHPFYEKFIVEISDNWRWDASYNVPLDEMMQVLDYALEKGYTVCWGTDVSEKGFNRQGIGVLLPDEESSTGSDQERWVGKSDDKAAPADASLPKELVPDQEYRQVGFDNKTTTDDHGMHIYGIAKDQNGTKYYLVKNSWGETGKYKGIWYCSENFVKGKTIEIAVHKDAVPKAIAKKLGIN